MRLAIRRAHALTLLLVSMLTAFGASASLLQGARFVADSLLLWSVSVAVFLMHVTLGWLLWWSFPPGDVDNKRRSFWRPTVWRLCLGWYVGLAFFSSVNVGVTAASNADAFVGLLSVLGMFGLVATAWHGVPLGRAAQLPRRGRCLDVHDSHAGVRGHHRTNGFGHDGR